MPQDGSNNYQYPPGTPGIPDTTIESEAYNTFLDDLVINDLNIPRPIHRGGTGASTADTALVNLTGEKASQVVTAYLSQLWLPGSFRSAIGATDAPVAGHAFAGIVYINEPLVSPPTNANVTVEARDMTDGKLYVRQKTAGTWGAWVEQAGGTTDLDAAYVNVAGDTMTGHLSLPITPAAANAVRKDYVDAADAGKVAKAGDTMSGALTVNANVTSTSNFFCSTTATVGQYHFGSSGTKYLQYDGTGFRFQGGPVTLVTGTLDLADSNNRIITDSASTFFRSAGFLFQNVAATVTYAQINGTAITANVPVNVFSDVRSARSGTTGVYYFGSGATTYLINDNTMFRFTPHAVELGGGFAGRAGSSGGFTSVINNFYWTGALQGWVDVSNLGNVTFSSDYRIKKDVIDLPDMWDTVKALRPIKYTQAAFSTPSHVDYVVGMKAKAKAEGKAEPSSGELFEADNIERWGFIAHELQETLTPSAATGVKDSYDHVQSPNPFTLIAALTKALQEAMTRIEALEAQQPA